MKKINKFTIVFFLLLNVSSCSGYKPIFSSSNLNLQFEITEYLIKPNKKVGNQIYTKLYNLSKSKRNNLETKSVHLTIQSSKGKSPTSKSSTGKIIIRDYLTNEEILNQNFIYSSSYKVQDQYSETLSLESKTVENLTDKTFQDLLIKISESLSAE
jgi:hypothetical protein